MCLQLFISHTISGYAFFSKYFIANVQDGLLFIKKRKTLVQLSVITLAIDILHFGLLNSAVRVIFRCNKIDNNYRICAIYNFFFFDSVLSFPFA